MDALFQREMNDFGLHQDDRPQFCEDGRVKLVDGPLAGMEDVFAEEDGGKRVSVLLELLGKSNKMSVDRDWVVTIV